MLVVLYILILPFAVLAELMKMNNGGHRRRKTGDLIKCLRGTNVAT